MAQFPSTSAADGIWTLKKVRRAILGDNWPPLEATGEFPAAFFDGSGDYLKTNSSSDFAFGTGNFTMEAWIYPTSVSGTQGVVSTRIDSTSNSNQVFFGLSGTDVLYYAGVAISGGTVATNEWAHIACSRSGSTVRVFLNGTQVASGTDSASKATTFGYVAAGGGDNSQLYTGYISNARFNTTALYTSDFSPTFPLTAVSGTVLLTCQGASPFVDNSGTSKTVNTNGDPALDSPTPPSTVTGIDLLVVAGGGSGGSGNNGGGGGAGGLRYLTGQSITTGVTYTVTVGNGGSSPGQGSYTGNDGQNSSFSGSGFTTITASGGGGGAAGGTTDSPRTGGSGGGANGYLNGGAGASGNAGGYTPSEGNNGGSVTSVTGPYIGGGGGGAGQAGANGGSSGGTGGNGVLNSITGSGVYYAGGGGGGTNDSYPISGGLGGGGAGSYSGSSGGTAGTNGLGGGGGAGASGTVQKTAGAGGSGVVIVRATGGTASATTGSPTVTTVGSDTVYKFTSSGSITF